MFGDSTTPEIVAGHDGWLFWSPYLLTTCDQLIADAESIAPRFPADHRFAVMVTRPKAAYHGDALPNAPDPCLRDARVRSDEIWGPLTADLDSALAELAASGVETFEKRDTHWSGAGRVAATRAVVDYFEPGLWDDSRLTTTTERRLAGLQRGLGWNRSGPTRAPAVTGQVEVRRRAIQPRAAEELLVRLETRSHAERVVPGVTVIVGDSQMSHIATLLAPYFEEMYFANWLAVSRIIDEQPSADRVLVQAIENAPARSFDARVIAQLAGLLRDDT